MKQIYFLKKSRKRPKPAYSYVQRKILRKATETPRNFFKKKRQEENSLEFKKNKKMKTIKKEPIKKRLKTIENRKKTGGKNPAKKIRRN